MILHKILGYIFMEPWHTTNLKSNGIPHSKWAALDDKESANSAGVGTTHHPGMLRTTKLERFNSDGSSSRVAESTGAIDPKTESYWKNHQEVPQIPLFDFQFLVILVVWFHIYKHGVENFQCVDHRVSSGSAIAQHNHHAHLGPLPPITGFSSCDGNKASVVKPRDQHVEFIIWVKPDSLINTWSCKKWRPHWLCPK